MQLSKLVKNLPIKYKNVTIQVKSGKSEKLLYQQEKFTVLFLWRQWYTNKKCNSDDKIKMTEDNDNKIWSDCCCNNSFSFEVLCSILIDVFKILILSESTQQNFFGHWSYFFIS